MRIRLGLQTLPNAPRFGKCFVEGHHRVPSVIVVSDAVVRLPRMYLSIRRSNRSCRLGRHPDRNFCDEPGRFRLWCETPLVCRPIVDVQVRQGRQIGKHYPDFCGCKNTDSMSLGFKDVVVVYMPRRSEMRSKKI